MALDNTKPKYYIHLKMSLPYHFRLDFDHRHTVYLLPG